MSEPYKNLEKISLDELKQQREELRSNPYAPGYIAILTVVVTQTKPISDRIQLLSESYNTGGSLNFIIFALFSMLVMGGWTIAFIS